MPQSAARKSLRKSWVYGIFRDAYHIRAPKMAAAAFA